MAQKAAAHHESEMRLRVEVEGVVFELTRGTDELSESPGRVALWVRSSVMGCQFKEYFDDLQSLLELSKFFDGAISAFSTRANLEARKDAA